MASMNRIAILLLSMLAVGYSAKISSIFQIRIQSDIADNESPQSILTSSSRNELPSEFDEPLTWIDSEQDSYPEGVRDSIVPTPYPIEEDQELLSEIDGSESSEVSWTTEPTIAPSYSPDRRWSRIEMPGIMPLFNGFNN